MSEHLNSFSRRAFVGGAAVFGAATCSLMYNPMMAFADPSAADKQAEAAAALENLNAMQTQLDIASNDYTAALMAQEDAQNKMNEAQARIDEANGQIADLQDQLGTRARSMYRTGSLTFIDLLLGATSFQAFTTNWDLLNSMNENDAEMVQETKDLRAEVEQQKATYAEQERIAAEQAEAARQVQEQAQAVVAEMQATYDSLSAEAAALLEAERAAKEEADRLAAQQVEDNPTPIEPDPEPSNPGSGSGSSSGDSTPPSVSGNVVVNRAYGEIGKPYIWAACGPEGFDCSGLVSYCLSGSYGVRLGTTYTFLGWPRVSNPQPGDVCTSSYHCGIYVGGGSMVHAPTEGQTVCVAPVQSDMVFVRY